MSDKNGKKGERLVNVFLQITDETRPIFDAFTDHIIRTALAEDDDPVPPARNRPPPEPRPRKRPYSTIQNPSPLSIQEILRNTISSQNAIQAPPPIPPPIPTIPVPTMNPFQLALFQTLAASAFAPALASSFVPQPQPVSQPQPPAGIESTELLKMLQNLMGNQPK